MGDVDELLEGRERQTNKLRTRIFWCLIGVVVFMTIPALALFSSPAQVWTALGFAAIGVLAAHWLSDFIMAPVYVLKRRLELANYGPDSSSEPPPTDLDLSGGGFELAGMLNGITSAKRLDLDMQLPQELAEIQRLSRAGRLTEQAVEAISGQIQQGISHGLKSPLAVLKGHCAKMREAVAAGDRQGIEECANAVGEISQYVADLVSQILSLAYVLDQAGKGVVGTKANVSAAIISACEVRRHTAAEKGMRVEADVEAGLWVRGERFLLQEMIANLVDNAVRYAPANTPIKVTAGRVPGSQTVLVVVTDRGPGIPLQERERVFEPYYGVTGIDGRGNTTYGSRVHRVLGPGVDKKSHGLGLALVKGIVKMHGAQISLGSGPGGIGLSVQIVLNACDPPTDSEDTAA